MTKSGFENNRFSETRKKIKALAGKIEGIARHEFLKGPTENFRRVFREKIEETKLHVAVCGAHSSGKSTLVRYLTGRVEDEKIRVGGGVTTDEIEEYDCGDWTIVDTPGICSGHPDHDDKTKGYMNRADLLLYMIPSERIDPEVAEDFKRTIMDRYCEKTMLLMGQLSDVEMSSLPAKRQEVAELVGGEDNLETYRFCVVDVQAYVQGDKNDDEELKVYSRVEEFKERLEDFLSKKGAYGKCIALLDVMDGFISGATEKCETQEERNEISRRQWRAITDAMENYRQACRNAKERMLRFLRAEQQEMLALFPENEKEFRERAESLEDRLEKEANDSTFQNDLQDLFGELEKTLENIDEQVVRLDQRLARAFGADIKGVQGFDMSKWKAGAQQIGNAIANMSKETFVKIVHFFGGKFKPWGAAKWLKILKGFGAAAPIAIELAEQVADAKAEAKEEEMRAEIRRNFEEIETTVREFYDGYEKTKPYQDLQVAKEKLDKAEADRRRMNEEKDAALDELTKLKKEVLKCRRDAEGIS